MNKRILKFIKLMLNIILITILAARYEPLKIIQISLLTIGILLILQFLYGLIGFKVEKFNSKVVKIIGSILYGVIIFFNIRTTINIVTIVNLLSIILSSCVVFRYLNNKRSFHNGLFNVLITLPLYVYLTIKYSNSSLLSLIVVPVFLIYMLQEMILDVNNKKPIKFAIVSSIIFIIVMITMFMNFSAPTSAPTFEKDIVLELIVIMGLIIFIRGLFYAYTVKSNKIEFLVYAILIAFFTLKLNDIYLVSVVPLIMLMLSISLDEKYELINLKKYIKSKTIKKVSAVIPNYNYANYIEKRIDSILYQTYPIHELIVLDDKSTDNSDEVIKEKIKQVKKQYPELKVKYIPNKKNSGNVFKQWQKAFEESTGDYLWICEADDLCSKHFLNAVMKAFDDENVVLSYAESRGIDENGNVFMQDMRIFNDKFNTGRWNHSYVIDGKKELANYLCICNSISNASGVVFKKDKSIDSHKYLKEAQEFRLAGDWYFYSKYLLHGKIAYCADSLNYHRLHSNSVTNTTENEKMYAEVEKVQKSIAKDVDISKKVQKQIINYNKSLKE